MKLLVFPRDPNPYQDLLYRQLDGQVEVAYLDVSQQSLLRFISFYPLLVWDLVSYRTRGWKILHLHWVYPFYVPKRVPLHRYLTYVQIKIFFAVLAMLGYKVVWTVHNVVPQIPQSPNDERLMQQLGRLAKAKIVHSTSALELMRTHGISTENFHLIPHGNYKGVYPDAITQENARRKLKIKPSEVVLLFFGNIAAYKGVDKLLDEMDKLNASQVRLILAGRCDSEALSDRINRSVKSGRVDYFGGYVRDEDVATYFKSADIVVLPFTTITTSGSTILALTFGKPVVAPRMGALKDIPDDAGFFYEPNDPNGLSEALELAISNRKRLAHRSLAARRYARSLDWGILAQKTYGVYQDLLARDSHDDHNGRGKS